MDPFISDVDKGLSASSKFLSSKYFYDKSGDKLFQKIMELEEYYLTRSEFEILNRFKDHLLNYFLSSEDHFQLIEFGAGDGLKTKVLLSHFLEKHANFKYLPIDISENVLKGLMDELDSTYPSLNGQGIRGDYFSVLNDLKKIKTRKVVMFLGSNIGNFTPDEAVQFLKKMKSQLMPGDYVLIGIDLKKDPNLILNAYNDKQGVTKEFNLNLLRRINRELGANFNLQKFDHAPAYDPDTGAATSHLVSLANQTVTIDAIGKQYNFTQGERIFTEISQKYSVSEIDKLAHDSEFEVVEHFFDSNGYFVDTLWRVS